MSAEAAPAYAGWAIVELMGHRQRAGRVSEAVQFGVAQLRLDIPLEDGGELTEFYGGSAIYAVRPCTEEVARTRARYFGDPRPVSPATQRLPPPDDPEDNLDDAEDATFSDIRTVDHG